MRWVFAFLVTALFWYEVVALVYKPSATISQIVWAITGKDPLAPLLLGILMGHFFWSGK